MVMILLALTYEYFKTPIYKLSTSLKHGEHLDLFR